MAKQDVKIEITMALDEQELGRPLHVFLYQMINRLGYEHEIKSVVVNGEGRSITRREDLVEIPLKKRMMRAQ